MTRREPSRGASIRRSIKRGAMKLVILTAVAVAALLFPGVAPARAETAVTCTVLEIEASSTAAPSIDVELRPLEKKLKKPPFSSWNTFKRLGTQSAPLELMKATTVTLVHGKAGLLLREVTTREKKKPRVALGITLDDEDGKRTLDTKVQVDAGDYLVVGRSLRGGKGQLVAVSCRP